MENNIFNSFSKIVDNISNEEQLAKTAELDININLGHFYYGATLLISSVKVQDSDSFDASSNKNKKLSVSANTTPTIKKITVNIVLSIPTPPLASYQIYSIVCYCTISALLMQAKCGNLNII